MHNDHENIMPAFSHDAGSTPFETHLDESFIDRTSPRLNTRNRMRNSTTLGRQPKLVIKDGTVVCEVVTRHRVMNRDGRDYGATVQVVVPAPLTPYGVRAEHDKVVAMMTCPGGQASEIAVFVGDAIAAMVEQNLMVPDQEDTKDKKEKKWQLDPRVFGPEWAEEGKPPPPSFTKPLNELMQDVMGELKAGNISAKDAVMSVIDACEEVKDMFPFMDMVLSEMEKKPDKDPAEVEQLRSMFAGLKQLYGAKDDGPSIKDEAADTQGEGVPVQLGDVKRMASYGFVDQVKTTCRKCLNRRVVKQQSGDFVLQVSCPICVGPIQEPAQRVIKACGWHSPLHYIPGLYQHGYQAHPQSLFGSMCRPEEPLMWHWYQEQKKDGFDEALVEIEKALGEEGSEWQKVARTSYRDALLKLRSDGEQQLKEDLFDKFFGGPQQPVQDGNV